MSTATPYLRGAALASACTVLLLAGCASDRPKYAETFSDKGTYTRDYAVSGKDACEAARRALLSQGYTIDKVKDDGVDASKNFQEPDQKHTQLSMHVVCATDGRDGQHSTTFVNAVQDHYIIKKNSTSAGVGLSVLGSVSMPFGSSDDSLTKIASETIDSPDFYDNFFDLMARYMPKPAPAGNVAQGQAAKDQAAKDQAAKDQAAKDQAAKDQAAKDQAAKDQAAKDQAAKDQAAKDQAAKDQANQGADAGAGSSSDATAKPADGATP
ncbi:hypothetical protein CAL29_15700 [Bordetella genomosp. 10]|uniref:DUF2242 domain-containing protein n=1 Tax=Bordetella genomosp. 10 TaxID=1416804 RepID=A0A261SBX3_9BORD|nr:DUF2242 domain-containing protein [Bordetella genomosp. 10]OZI34899.1 hypothetical protein CAL29_15700 [Bordetella genomosp. 10]